MDDLQKAKKKVAFCFLTSNKKKGFLVAIEIAAVFY